MNYTVALILFLTSCGNIQNTDHNKSKNTLIENTMKQENSTLTDNSKKTILARACDPSAAVGFAKMISPLIGNAEYIPTTDDADFIEKLKTQKWSVVFFAPGACRFSAAKQAIPGGNAGTAGWTMEQYKDLVHKLQGADVQIVETFDEQETIGLLNKALLTARETK